MKMRGADALRGVDIAGDDTGQRRFRAFNSFCAYFRVDAAVSSASLGNVTYT